MPYEFPFKILKAALLIPNRPVPPIESELFAEYLEEKFQTPPGPEEPEEDKDPSMEDPKEFVMPREIKSILKALL